MMDHEFELISYDEEFTKNPATWSPRSAGKPASR